MITNFLLVYLGVMAFALNFSTPKKALLSVGFTGAVGFLIYEIFRIYFHDIFLGAFLGSFVLGLLSGFFARRYKMPTTVFFQAGIIPLVPGRALYSMMYHLVMNNFSLGLQEGLSALMISGLISLGVYFTSFISDSIRYSVRRARRGIRKSPKSSGL